MPTTLSPRLKHLLIQEDDYALPPGGAVLRPLRHSEEAPSFPPPTLRFPSRPPSGISLPTPISPRTSNASLGPSPPPSPRTSHSSHSYQPSPAPSSLPAGAASVRSIHSLLNDPRATSPPAPPSSASSAGSVLRAEQEKPRRRATPPYPPRANPPPATFPISTAGQSQSAYFDERSYPPPPPPPHPQAQPHADPRGAGYARYSYPHLYEDAHDRPALYRRHSSHPYGELHPHPHHRASVGGGEASRGAQSAHASLMVHRHSQPHAHALPPSAPPSSSTSRPSTAYAAGPGPYEPEYPVASSRAPISRTTKACNACRGRKVRCDAGVVNGAGVAGEAACTRCRESSLECVYTSVQKKRGPCPGTARPASTKSRRPSAQIPQFSPVSSSHRSSIASIQTSLDVVTPEDHPWGNGTSYGFPAPASGQISPGTGYEQGYHGHGHQGALPPPPPPPHYQHHGQQHPHHYQPAGKHGHAGHALPPPQGWPVMGGSARGSYDSAGWDERRWSAVSESGRGYP
ncbi:hypothetical protein IAT38_008079 [Cryptococcus sp. DSM 104549]